MFVMSCVLLYNCDATSGSTLCHGQDSVYEARSDVHVLCASESPAPMYNPACELVLLPRCSSVSTIPHKRSGMLLLTSLAVRVQVALRWFCERSLMRNDGISKDLIDRIPGRQTDRKTPLGELNWIFTAITDTIAWNMLPRPLFQKLFRSVRPCLPHTRAS